MIVDFIESNGTEFGGILTLPLKDTSPPTNNLFITFKSLVKLAVEPVNDDNLLVTNAVVATLDELSLTDCVGTDTIPLMETSPLTNNFPFITESSLTNNLPFNDKSSPIIIV